MGMTIEQLRELYTKADPEPEPEPSPEQLQVLIDVIRKLLEQKKPVVN
jgi:hypothetical protein